MLAVDGVQADMDAHTAYKEYLDALAPLKGKQRTEYAQRIRKKFVVAK